MRYRLSAVVAFAFVSLAFPIAGHAQAPAAKAKPSAKAWNGARLPWGDPDLQGMWNNDVTTPLERPAGLEGKAVLSDDEAEERDTQTLDRSNRDRRDGAGTDLDVGRAYNDFWWEYGKSDGRTSLVVDPADGRIPALTPAAQKRVAAQTAARQLPAEGPEDRSTYERCITRGVPVMPGAYNNNFQIVQSPGYVAILIEMIHEVRIIPLDGRPHIGPETRQWLGDSRGHWEGSTLVVDTTNFSDKISFRGSDPNLHLIERLTRVDANTIKYEFTIDDPTAFTKSWTAVIPWTLPSVGIRGATVNELYEYGCHEGNLGLYGILAGARVQEKNAAEAARKGSN